MEQLTEDAVAARKEGLTYGQYIAKYRPPLPMPERFPKKKTKAETAGEPAQEQGQAVHCAICGAEILNAKKGRKYCGAECADIAITRQRAECAKRRKEARAANNRQVTG